MSFKEGAEARASWASWSSSPIKEVELMINLNQRLLFILLLGAVIGVMITVDEPDGQELLGLLSSAAIGALLG